MNPVFFIIIIVTLGIILVPLFWVFVVFLLKKTSRKLNASIFIAAGHLKGRRKKGFVSVIGLISIYAICASSCHVTTVLSVMGGFGDDLKQKILGAKAHIIIDSKNGLLKNEHDLLKIVKNVPEVVGAYFYIEEELMIRSPLNISGAVIRGIELWDAVKVTNLGSTIIEGSLDVLTHPEKMRRNSFNHPSGKATPLHEIDRSLNEIEERGKEGGLFHEDRNKDKDEERKLQISPNSRTKNGESNILPSVIIGKEMAKNLGVFVGDEVKLISPLGDIGPTGPVPKFMLYTVGAIFFSGMYEYDAKNIYVSLESARKFLGIPEGVTGIEVRISKPHDAERVVRKLKQEFAERNYYPRIRHWKELNRSLFSALLLEKIGMFLMLSLTILIASFSIISTLVMLVMEKTQDIAVLKTLGASDKTIIKIFHFEGFLLGFVGTIIGVSLGILLCWFIKHFGVPINPEVHYIDKLPVKMEPVEIIMVAFASFLICLLITYYPAKLASKQRIIEGLRNR